MTVIESLASSAVLTAAKIDARLIVVLATNGYAARLIAKYRPNVPVIVGVVPRGELREAIGFMYRSEDEMRVARQCNLTRGLVPFITNPKDQVGFFSSLLSFPALLGSLHRAFRPDAAPLRFAPPPPPAAEQGEPGRRRQGVRARRHQVRQGPGLRPPGGPGGHDAQRGEPVRGDQGHALPRGLS